MQNIPDPSRTRLKQAFQTLIPSGRHTDYVAFFNDRVPYGTIAHWRAGRRPMPQWAVDIFRSRWHAYCAAIADTVEQLKPAPGRIGRIGENTRAKLLAKEKPDSKAGL